MKIMITQTATSYYGSWTGIILISAVIVSVACAFILVSGGIRDFDRDRTQAVFMVLYGCLALALATTCSKQLREITEESRLVHTIQFEENSEVQKFLDEYIVLNRNDDGTYVVQERELK